MSAMTICDDQEDPWVPKFQGEDSSFRLSAMKGDHLIQLEEPSTIFFVPTCGSLGFTISDFVGRILPFFFPRPLSPTRWCSSSAPPTIIFCTALSTTYLYNVANFGFYSLPSFNFCFYFPHLIRL